MFCVCCSYEPHSDVSTLTSILEDIGWIEQEPSGKYIITDKGNSEVDSISHGTKRRNGC